MPDNEFDLTGKVAVVTGASRGLGQYLGRALARAGADLVITSRKLLDLAPFQEEIESLGRRVFPYELDLRDAGSMSAAAKAAVNHFGKIDILVNNAGGARAFTGGASTIPDEEWQDVFELNLFAGVRLTNALLPALRESKAAAIVNISSIAATMAFAQTVHYTAAKAALDAYSRSLAVELAPSKIRVNVVSPGPISTPSSNEWRKNVGFQAMRGPRWCR